MAALVLAAGGVSTASSQIPADEPRLILGLRGGEFRVSLDRFEEVYASRWGFCFGGDAAARVYGNLYAFVGGRRCAIAGNDEGHVGASPRGQAHWEEKWLLVGVRRWSLGERRWGSAVGLGYAFFWVEEDPEVAVLPLAKGGGGTQKGRGFFLTVSIDYSLRPWFALATELEVTSAGVGGRSGFEGSSIGGFFFSLGVNVRPF